MKTTVSKLLIARLAALLLASFLIVPVADAKERGGDRNVKVNNSKSDVRSTSVSNGS